MFETTRNLEYKKEVLRIILVSEDFENFPYNDKAKNDGSGYLTIGYGVNLKERDWLIVVLNELGLFGDIATINSATDITALDNANNKTTINEFYNITKALVADDTLATTKANLNTLFRKHKNITEGKFEVTKEQGLNVKEVVSDTIFNGVSVINDKAQGNLKLEFRGLKAYQS